MGREVPLPTMIRVEEELGRREEMLPEPCCKALATYEMRRRCRGTNRRRTGAGATRCCSVWQAGADPAGKMRRRHGPEEPRMEGAGRGRRCVWRGRKWPSLHHAHPRVHRGPEPVWRRLVGSRALLLLMLLCCCWRRKSRTDTRHWKPRPGWTTWPAVSLERLATWGHHAWCGR